MSSQRRIVCESPVGALDASRRIMTGELNILEWFRNTPRLMRVEPCRDMITVICRGLGANVTAFKTEEGLVLCDSGSVESAPLVFQALREWAPRERVHTIILTHGHFDHVNGAELYMNEAQQLGLPLPRVIAHKNIVARFARYIETAPYNARINRRQYSRPKFPWPTHYPTPDILVQDSLRLHVGSLQLELFHARGETNDHLWIWHDSHRTVIAGDFIMWASPNAGNPQKVQRYAMEWARALRAMLSCSPEIVVGGHGPVLMGSDVIQRYLSNTAKWLESLHNQTIALLNAGTPFGEIIHRVQPPTELAEEPYLQPNYDDPEFVVRNILRLVGGWWDGNAANLKPARPAELAQELCELAGGSNVMAERARALVAEGQLRLAGHLAEFAVLAGGGSLAHVVRAEVNEARALVERSQMSKGIFREAAAESRNAV